MSNHAIAASSRCELLRERCEQQRQQLAQQFATIETQLQTADVIVSTIGRAIRRPELWMAALAGLAAIKRLNVWSWIGRGWMIWSTARRMMDWFKH
jgi:hypothetical protein